MTALARKHRHLTIATQNIPSLLLGEIHASLLTDPIPPPPPTPPLHTHTHKQLQYAQALAEMLAGHGNIGTNVLTRGPTAKPTCRIKTFCDGLHRRLCCLVVFNSPSPPSWMLLSFTDFIHILSLSIGNNGIKP